MDNHKLVTLEHMLIGHRQRVESIGNELTSFLSSEEIGYEKKFQSAVVQLERIVDQTETLKKNVLEMFE